MKSDKTNDALDKKADIITIQGNNNVGTVDSGFGGI